MFQICQKLKRGFCIANPPNCGPSFPVRGSAA